MNNLWPKPTAQKLPDQVSKTILHQIAIGELRPGDKLPPLREMATNLNVGISVVREAVQRLQVLKIVDSHQGSGTRIRPFRWIQLIYDPSLFMMAVQNIGLNDFWEARYLIEEQIACLAVRKATEHDLKAMRKSLQKAKPYPKIYDRNMELNREFHMAVARASKNSVLEDMVSPLLDIRLTNIDHRFDKEMSRKTWQIHKTIYDAIAGKNLDAVKIAIKGHYEVGSIALKEIIERSNRLQDRNAL